MIVSLFRGHEWEPSPVFEQHVSGGVQDAHARAVQPQESTPESGAAPERGDGRPGGPRVVVPREGPAERSARRAAEHLRRYFTVLRTRKERGGRGPTPEDLYLVDETKDAIREVVGFRMRGHPLAILGAFSFPRHERSNVPHGRVALAPFLSKPPRDIGYSSDPKPPGSITIHLPRIEESVPAFMERLQTRGGTGIHVDTNVIDVAFDLRFSNPSAIRRHSAGVAQARRSVFRTIAGHVVSGLSVGLNQTLHKDSRFITLANPVQHRPRGDVVLPTIAVNRSILALQTPVPEDDDGTAVQSMLAFHPSTASDEHILGWAYDGIG